MLSDPLSRESWLHTWQIYIVIKYLLKVERISQVIAWKQITQLIKYYMHLKHVPYWRCVPLWVAYGFGISLCSERVRRYCERLARPTSKASISQLAFGSPLITLAPAELELQKLWPRSHKESNDVKISGHSATSHHVEPWEQLKALLKFGAGGVVINQNSLALSHSLQCLLLPLPLSLLQPLGLSRPGDGTF